MGQQAGNCGQREPGLFDPVLFGVDSIVDGCSEIGFFQHRTIEGSAGQVALLKYRIAEIAFRKVGFFQLAVTEAGPGQFQLVKRSMVEQAVVEGEGHAKGIAIGKLQAQHFTVLEMSIAYGSLVKFRQAEVAADKGATGEELLLQVGLLELAAGKGTTLVFGFGQGLQGGVPFIENPVCNIFRFHLGLTLFGVVACKAKEFINPDH